MSRRTEKERIRSKYPHFIPVSEFAIMLGISEKATHRLIIRERVPHAVLGKRRRILLKDAVSFMEKVVRLNTENPKNAQ